MMFHVLRSYIVGNIAVILLIGLSVTAGYLYGWTGGHQEATSVQERGWNWVVYSVVNRQSGVELAHLLGRTPITGCEEVLHDIERPLPLLVALERSTRETQCYTEAFRAETARRRQPAPATLPGGQVRIQPIGWTPSWGWLTGQPLTREAVLPGLKANFPRLDLVVEYPFGTKDGAWVTLGGCLENGIEAKSARKFLYALRGVAVVLDRTRRTPKPEKDIPGYVDSACSADYLHDGRQVARWMMTPRRADTHGVEHTLNLLKDADHRARVVRAIEQGEDIEARGVHFLAMALQEIHKVLYRSDYFQTDTQRVSSLKMMFNVWARMPAPGTEE